MDKKTFHGIRMWGYYGMVVDEVFGGNKEVSTSKTINKEPSTTNKEIIKTFL